MATDAARLARAEGLFGDQSAAYRAHRPTYPPAALDAVLAASPVAPRSAVVLDVACGSGQVAAALAGRVARVIGIDAAAAQVGAARAACTAPNVEFRVAAAEANGLAAASMDVVVVAQGLHWCGAGGEWRLRGQGLGRRGWAGRQLQGGGAGCKARPATPLPAAAGAAENAGSGTVADAAG